MAKKDKDKIVGEENESGGSKLVTALIAIVIILIWLAVFAFLIKMDVGGIGSKVLYPVLKDVPVVNKILLMFQKICRLKRVIMNTQHLKLQMRGLKN